METRAGVVEFLSDLRSTHWFHAVGGPVSIARPRGVAVARVGSWPEAMRVIKSRRTEEFLTESQNFLYREQGEATKDIVPAKFRVRDFNNWIVQIGEGVRQVEDEACGAPAIPPDVAAAYRPVLRWMVQKGCVVYQYDQYIKRNRLYVFVGQLLRAGHCVCGWDGRFPAGTLVVF